MKKISNMIYVAIIKFMLYAGIDKYNSKVLDLIISDMFRYKSTYNRQELFELIISDTGFKFTFFLRFASIGPRSFLRKRVHALSYYFHRKYFFAYGYQIPIKTKIGKGLQILHFGNVVINSASIIGENCTIAQGVLIGQSNRGVPIIGNKVWIGANSILVGDITVGNNVLIAPGSFVNINIPENSLVIGNPCEIYPKTASIIDGYIVNATD